MMKNIVGNWTFSPVYTFETGEWVTLQAQEDANLNGDPAGDRAITNPAGVRGTGSDVTALCRVANPCDPNTGVVVAYLANSPTAQYIRTGLGALPNTGWNTLQTQDTDNIDLGIYKNLKITETKSSGSARLETSSTIPVHSRKQSGFWPGRERRERVCFGGNRLHSVRHPRRCQTSTILGPCSPAMLARLHWLRSSRSR